MPYYNDPKPQMQANQKNANKMSGPNADRARPMNKLPMFLDQHLNKSPSWMAKPMSGRPADQAALDRIDRNFMPSIKRAARFPGSNSFTNPSGLDYTNYPNRPLYDLAQPEAQQQDPSRAYDVQPQQGQANISQGYTMGDPQQTPQQSQPNPYQMPNLYGMAGAAAQLGSAAMNSMRGPGREYTLDQQMAAGLNEPNSPAGRAALATKGQNDLRNRIAQIPDTLPMTPEQMAQMGEAQDQGRQDWYNSDRGRNLQRQADATAARADRAEGVLNGTVPQYPTTPVYSPLEQEGVSPGYYNSMAERDKARADAIAAKGTENGNRFRAVQGDVNNEMTGVPERGAEVSPNLYKPRSESNQITDPEVLKRTLPQISAQFANNNNGMKFVDWARANIAAGNPLFSNPDVIKQLSHEYGVNLNQMPMTASETAVAQQAPQTGVYRTQGEINSIYNNPESDQFLTKTQRDMASRAAALQAINQTPMAQNAAATARQTRGEALSNIYGPQGGFAMDPIYNLDSEAASRVMAAREMARGQAAGNMANAQANMYGALQNAEAQRYRADQGLAGAQIESNLQDQRYKQERDIKAEEEFRNFQDLAKAEVEQRFPLADANDWSDPSTAAGKWYQDRIGQYSGPKPESYTQPTPPATPQSEPAQAQPQAPAPSQDQGQGGPARADIKPNPNVLDVAGRINRTIPDEKRGVATFSNARDIMGMIKSQTQGKASLSPSQVADVLRDGAGIDIKNPEIAKTMLLEMLNARTEYGMKHRDDKVASNGLWYATQNGSGKDYVTGVGNFDQQYKSLQSALESSLSEAEINDVRRQAQKPGSYLATDAPNNIDPRLEAWNQAFNNAESWWNNS